MQRAVLLVVVAFFLAAVLGACGSRGPLDDDIILITDAGVPETSIVDANAPDVVAVVDSGKPVVDAGTGLIQCGTCVAQTCGTDVTTCLTDPSCQTILTCVATTCFNLGGLGGGGFPDPAPPVVGFAQKTPDERRAIFEEAFSAWPELTSREK